MRGREVPRAYGDDQDVVEDGFDQGVEPKEDEELEGQEGLLIVGKIHFF